MAAFAVFSMRSLAGRWHVGDWTADSCTCLGLRHAARHHAAWQATRREQQLAEAGLQAAQRIRQLAEATSAKAELALAKDQAEQRLQRSQQAQQQLNKELVICEQQVSRLGGSSIILTSCWSL